MSLKMSVAQRQTFLADPHVGIVSIPRESRGPLTVPIWYDYTPNGPLWMITDRSSIKGKLLARATRISLCVQTETVPYQYVSVEGTFTLRDATRDELLQMAIRYLGESGGRAYTNSTDHGDSMLVSITPQTWYTVDYTQST
jgi:general stress protein 26